MMQILKGALVAAVLAAGAGQALAQAQATQAGTPSPWEPFYVGVTYGQGHWRVGCFNTAQCDDTHPTLRALAGWQLNKYFAVEAAYHNLGKATSPGFFVKANAWEGVLVASWPLFDALSVYGRAGGYRGATESNQSTVPPNTNYSGVYGAGLSYELTRNIGLRFQWESYIQISGGQVSPKSDIDVISVGALWRFR